jgi:Fe2+ transport system protein FeoA
MKQYISLDKLSPREKGTVIFIRGNCRGLRRRLLDMGIIPGTQLEMCKRAPMGDPIEVILRGYYLTLRIDEARRIELEVDR